MNIKKSVFILTLCVVSMPEALLRNDQKRATTKKKRKPIHRTIKDIAKKIMPVASNVLNAIVDTIVSDKGIDVIRGALKDGKIDAKDVMSFVSLFAKNVTKDTMQQPKEDTTQATTQEQIDKITAQIVWQELMSKEKIRNESIIALKEQAEAKIAPLIPNAEDTITQNTLSPHAQKIAQTITEIMMLDQKTSEAMKTIISNLATSHDVSLDAILSLAAHVSADLAKRSLNNPASAHQSTTSQNQIESEIKDQLKQQLTSKTLNEPELEGAVQNQVRGFDETDIPQNRDTSDDASTTDTSINESDQFMASDGTKGYLPKPVYDDATLMNADTLM